MFIKDFPSKVNFDEIIKNESDIEVFELMKKRLNSLGFDVILITSVERESSHYVTQCDEMDKFSWYSKSQKVYYKDIPVLSLYIRTNDNYKSLGINEDVSEPIDKSVLGIIKKIWREVLIESDFNVERYYDLDMTIYIFNFHKNYLISRVYEMRDKVILEVSAAEVITPKEIYCSSIPSYNIIYSNADDYARARDNGEFRVIKEIISKLLSEDLHIKYPNIIEEFDFIKFYHPEMKGFSWYGFARQD
jgi:hypothetical protein